MKTRIRKGDTVQIISGTTDDKGKQGEVIRVIRKTDRVVIQELNMRTKHQGQVQTQGRNIAPGIIEFEGPMHISNVMLVCPKCKEATRISFRREEKQSVRVCKKCGKDID